MKEPMGYGTGSYPLIWFKHVDQNNLDNTIKKNEVIKNWYDQGIENKRQYIQNYFFTILHDGGLLPSVFFLDDFIYFFIQGIEKQITYILPIFIVFNYLFFFSEQYN